MAIQRNLCIMLAATLGGFGFLNAQAPGQGIPEYQVKARLLNVLANYTTWPQGSDTNDIRRPFVLGIIGQSPFEGYLDMYFQNELIKGKQPKVRFLNGSENLDNVDMLFICSSHFSQLPVILQRVKGKAILTAGDTPEFARSGVMVNFYLDGERVKVEINLKAVQREQITISSHVLRLARIVE